MPTLAFDQLVIAVVFAGMRIAGVMVYAPVLGSDAVTAAVKAGLTVFLTALLYPAYAGPGLSHTLEKSGGLGWIEMAGAEVVIGLLLGLTLQFVFEAAEFAGQIVGMQTGFSLVNILDPQTQVDTPVLSVFHQLIVTLIFLRLNVHHWLLRGLAATFSYLPAGGGRGMNLGLGSVLLRAAAGIWIAGVQIAAPVLLATLLCDVALGFVGKASPQLPVVFFGLSIKSMLGLLVLAGTLALWPGILETRFSAAIAISERLLHLAG
ncbi:MAG: flagellar biosynthetic protein FliR [Terriglobales bacterium]